MAAVFARITGKVQGVSYRASAQEQAQSLGLAGWVRNTSEGAVELLASGPDDAVAALLDWCRQGPGGAHVESVETRAPEEPELKNLPESFDARR
ncbi:acylphosphatase [Nesterenkonia populi]